MSAPAPVRLIAVTPGDAADLAALHAEAFAQPWSTEELAELLDGPGALAIAARTDADLTGFILGRVVADEGEVLTLAVRPQTRRAGVGAALVEALCAAMRSRSVDVLWLEVAADNAAAQALYRRAGFQSAGRRPGYYARPGGERVDAMMMRRVLNTAVR